MQCDPKKTLFLIDGSSFLYRSYYGLRPLHTAKGVPVQAVYSFCRMIKKLIDTFAPEHIAIIWDSKGKTTRHQVYQEYKATRQAPPSDLFDQKALIMQFADTIGLKQVATQGIEADDIMYSIAQEQKKEGHTVVLVTSDKDMGQTIEDERIVLYDPWKNQFMNQIAFEQKMGFPVERLPFYFAILGDTSDNIPGVKGIGQKGALDLVQKFQSLEDLYARIDQVAKDRMKTALLMHKDNAFLSYQLFLLQMHPSGLSFADFSFKKEDWQKARTFFEELDFKTLLKELDVSGAVQKGVQREIAEKMLGYEFITITGTDQLEHLCSLIKQRKLVAIDTETNGWYPLIKNSCVGISFCVQQGAAYYLPFGHKNVQQLSQDYVVQMLRPLFEDREIHKVFHNAKFDQEALHSIGLEVNGIIGDTMIAANLITPDWQRIGLKYLSEYYFNEPMLTFQEVVKDNKYKDFSYVPLELATKYAAADAHQTFRLRALLEKALKEEKLADLYQTIEFPLTQVLYQMEKEGISLDVPLLESLGKKIESELDAIMKEIGIQAGVDMAQLNLNSPRQVEQLLFVTLQLPPQKKSAKRTGYSTDQEVLEFLRSLHPVPGLIMKHRELSKLKSTYIDALPTYVNPHTHKVHTTFSQTSTATGRLASSEPNLQNIPTNTGYGIEIRAAFIPSQGSFFLSADYSQIELRILAYFSQDPTLIDAFLKGQDVHAETASALFQVPLALVTSEQRQIGKRINFSVLYGMTPYGLSQDLGIPFKNAKIYIERYFARYPKVMEWMEKVIIDAKHQGYVSTLWGRRRYVPAIHEKNRSLYEEARRIAINTVVQGTAADIMKLGMLKIHSLFAAEHLRSKIVLQIHDELLIQVPHDEAHKVSDVTKNVLENIVSWNVPLLVTTRVGKNWKEVTK